MERWQLVLHLLVGCTNHLEMNNSVSSSTVTGGHPKMAPELRIPSPQLCMGVLMPFWTQKLLLVVAFEVISKGINISVAASGALSCLIPLFTQIISDRRIPTVQCCWWIGTDEER